MPDDIDEARKTATGHSCGTLVAIKKRKTMRHTLISIIFSFSFLLACSGHTNIINPDSIDNIELVQVDHPYLGYKVSSQMIDSKLIADFIKDFSDKKEEIRKFYSCYVIKIHFKNGTLISYRTNGLLFEKLKDDNTEEVYFKLNSDINLVTKYWGISKEKFCDTKESSAILHAPDRVGEIPQDAFWVGGFDGGQWYLVDSINKIARTIHFIIYNDYNGDIVADKIYKLHCDNNQEVKWDNIQVQINCFDGVRIILTTINIDGKYCFFE